MSKLSARQGYGKGPRPGLAMPAAEAACTWGAGSWQLEREARPSAKCIQALLSCHGGEAYGLGSKQ